MNSKSKNPVVSSGFLLIARQGTMHEGQDIAFDRWVLRPITGELFRDGTCLRLQDRSLQILTLLLSRPGDLVTREELIAHLWPKAVVDYDTGINTAMRKLRIALNDDPDSPRYIETVPRKGYRFIGKFDPAPPLPAAEGTGERRATRGSRVAIAAVIAISLFVGAITLYEWRASITRAATPTAPRTATPAAPRTAIAVPFANLTGDASKDQMQSGTPTDLRRDVTDRGIEDTHRIPTVSLSVDVLYTTGRGTRG